MNRSKTQQEHLETEPLERRAAPIEALAYPGPTEIDPATGGDEPAQLDMPGGSDGVRRDVYHR